MKYEKKNIYNISHDKYYYVVFYNNISKDIRIYQCYRDDKYYNNHIAVYCKSKNSFYDSLIYLYEDGDSGFGTSTVSVPTQFILYDDKIEALNKYKEITDKYIDKIKENYHYYINNLL